MPAMIDQDVMTAEEIRDAEGSEWTSILYHDRDAHNAVIREAFSHVSTAHAELCTLRSNLLAVRQTSFLDILHVLDQSISRLAFALTATDCADTPCPVCHGSTYYPTGDAADEPADCPLCTRMEDSMSKVTAVTRISYDNRTDVIEITGRRQVGSVPARITKAGYDIANAHVMGWGEHNAVIAVDMDYEDIGGYWLATINQPQE